MDESHQTLRQYRPETKEWLFDLFIGGIKDSHHCTEYERLLCVMLLSFKLADTRMRKLLGSRKLGSFSVRFSGLVDNGVGIQRELQLQAS